MLPAPSLAQWFVGDRVFAGSPYGSAREYMADIARIYREEIAELASLGCTYVQIDEVPIAVICDPAVQSVIAKRGEVPLALGDLYVETINDAIRERPPGMTVVVHMCRGNEGVAGLGSGGYDAIAERVFGRLKVDGYLLEYDTPRAGDFAPLRFLPQHTIAVLGLISTKVTELRIQGRTQESHRRGRRRHRSRPTGALPPVRFRNSLPLRSHGPRRCSSASSTCS
jgi:5-methyltetrahydropteroyltriglutamate--homocysteine methyltransferase